MKQHFFAAIQAHFDLEIVSRVPGPRQFVAQTYILRDVKGERYFCKIVDKPLFIAKLVSGLAAVAEMHEKGIKQICYPIRGKEGFYVGVEDSIVVLYNYIPAPQSEAYSMHAFGKLLSEIHAVTPLIQSTTSTEQFVFVHRALFEELFERHVKSGVTDDAVLQALQLALSTNAEEIRRFYARFLELSQLCRVEAFEPVLTHDDAPGNVLVKSQEDIFIIDWDGIQRAPAERDTWMVDHFPEFMRGYRTVRPNFVTNPNLRNYAILHYYFERIVYYLVEILNESNAFGDRVRMAESLNADMFKGWMTPKLQEVWRGQG